MICPPRNFPIYCANNNDKKTRRDRYDEYKEERSTTVHAENKPVEVDFVVGAVLGNGGFGLVMDGVREWRELSKLPFCMVYGNDSSDPHPNDLLWFIFLSTLFLDNWRGGGAHTHHMIHNSTVNIFQQPTFGTCTCPSQRKYFRQTQPRRGGVSLFSSYRRVHIITRLIRTASQVRNCGVYHSVARTGCLLGSFHYCYESYFATVVRHKNCRMPFFVRQEQRTPGWCLFSLVLTPLPLPLPLFGCTRRGRRTGKPCRSVR